MIPDLLEPNAIVWFTCSGVKAPSLRAGLQPQILPLTGHMAPVSLSGWTMDSSIRVSVSHLCPNLTPLSLGCLFLCLDVDLDAVVSSTEKLRHPTASRPRVTDRRPRSQILTPVSVQETYCPNYGLFIFSLWQSSLSNIELDPPTVEDRKGRRKDDQEPVSDVKTLLPKPSILPPPNSSHRIISPSSSSGPSPSPELRQSPLTPPPTLEELRNQLRDLRASIDLLKLQHK
ncbi:hypothetical protein GOODEAATRI_018643 [Goodea atripinnis]|uniref:Mitochondrial fission regulator 2 n=1 Tax=Goodea atripinnis TaxID=208336 RepID=A0ABV0NBT0_9TELE